MSKKLLFVTAAALINAEEQILLAQRPKGKDLEDLWEFPGGKLHEGETPEEGLKRELKEELNIDVKETDLAPFTFASHSYPNFHLFMPLYLCSHWQGELQPMEGQDIAWVSLSDLDNYEMPPADKPLIPALKKALAI